MARLTTHRALAALSGAAIIGVLATTAPTTGPPKAAELASSVQLSITTAPTTTTPTRSTTTAPTTAPTRSTTTAPTTAPAPTTRWQAAITYPDKQAAAAKIVKAAGRAPVRVVTLRTVNGRPKIVTQILSGASAAQLTRQAAADPEVLALDVDTRSSALATDPYRSTQWALDALAADTVNARHDASGVTVAVIDSGVQADHPDLAGVVLTGTDFVAPGGDGSSDGAGHGTHVAGIIAAVADNGIGVAGFAHGAKILPVRVLDNSGSGWNSDIASGIIWAADHAAKVINLSLGGPTRDAVMDSAVNYAVSRERSSSPRPVTAGRTATRSLTRPPSPTPSPSRLLTSLARRRSFSNTGGYVRIARHQGREHLLHMEERWLRLRLWDLDGDPVRRRGCRRPSQRLADLDARRTHRGAHQHRC